jgi:hypothetical protein
MYDSEFVRFEKEGHKVRAEPRREKGKDDGEIRSEEMKVKYSLQSPQTKTKQNHRIRTPLAPCIHKDGS